MKRIRIGIGILLCLGVLTLGLWAVLGRPNDTEAVLRKHGTAGTRAYMESKQPTVPDMVMMEYYWPEAPLAQLPVRHELKTAGWSGDVGENDRRIRMESTGQSVDELTVYPNGAYYSRPASGWERWIHKVKSWFGKKDQDPAKALWRL